MLIAQSHSDDSHVNHATFPCESCMCMNFAPARLQCPAFHWLYTTHLPSSSSFFDRQTWQYFVVDTVASNLDLMMSQAAVCQDNNI